MNWRVEICNGFLTGLSVSPETVCRGDSLLARKVLSELEEYFAGFRKTFDIPLKPEGTPFQKKIWDLLGKIPYGETWSYGRLAREAECPGGARAAGQACNRNPILILIPCHRVIG